MQKISQWLIHLHKSRWPESGNRSLPWTLTPTAQSAELAYKIQYLQIQASNVWKSLSRPWILSSRDEQLVCQWDGLPCLLRLQLATDAIGTHIYDPLVRCVKQWSVTCIVPQMYLTPVTIDSSIFTTIRSDQRWGITVRYELELFVLLSKTFKVQCVSEYLVCD